VQPILLELLDLAEHFDYTELWRFVMRCVPSQALSRRIICRPAATVTPWRVNGLV